VAAAQVSAPPARVAAPVPVPEVARRAPQQESQARPTGGSPVAARTAPTTVKIVIAGGFAVGKTTFIGSISDVEPLNTEAAMTEHSVGVDDAGGVSDRKTTTTVAMDFGRVALPGNLWLYLFGTPGQDRFLFMWDDLVRGAIGGVVLVDTDRLEQCFPAIDYFESRSIPFVVGVNCFDGVAKHRLEDVREALQIPAGVPMLYTDARSRTATKQTLISLVQLAMRQLRSGTGS
jgi:signal recognition particle receptor subunit beta